MSESKQYPDIFKYSRGGWFYRYNIEQVERQVDGETETMYRYDEVWVEEVTEGALVNAVVRTKYSVGDEFKLNRMTKTSTEWKEYDQFVDSVVEQVENDIVGA